MHLSNDRPGLPSYLKQRMARFHDDRVNREWGGRNIFRRRPAPPGSLILCNNDYLAISRHPRLIDAQCASLARRGVGLMMSPIFDQDPEGPRRRVEQRLADAAQSAEGILTQSGYCANIGLMQAVAGAGTPVYIDAMAHASLRAGIRSAGAIAVRFRHNDLSDLHAKMSQDGPGSLVVDSVYSTDGSVAPLCELADMAAAFESVMIVDESHSFGTHGVDGCGLVASQCLADKVHFVTVSLAKAYCSRAGFIACPAGFRDYFAFESLPAIFSSDILPHDLAGIEAAHDIVIDEAWRRTRLHDITRYVRVELAAMGYPVDVKGEQIIALEVGSDVDAAAVRDRFEEHGIFGALFTPPATSRGRSLVRISLHAGLSDTDVGHFLKTLRHLRKAVRLTDWSGVRNMRA